MNSATDAENRFCKDGVEIITFVGDPFTVGGVLSGMVEVGETSENRRTVCKIRGALRILAAEFDKWRIGVLPNREVVLVERGPQPRRCAKCAFIPHKWGELYVATPMDPLPPDVAERILRRMLRNFDWDTLSDSTG